MKLVITLLCWLCLMKIVAQDYVLAKTNDDLEIIEIGDLTKNMNIGFYCKGTLVGYQFEKDTLIAFFSRSHQLSKKKFPLTRFNDLLVNLKTTDKSDLTSQQTVYEENGSYKVFDANSRLLWVGKKKIHSGFDNFSFSYRYYENPRFSPLNDWIVFDEISYSALCGFRKHCVIIDSKTGKTKTIRHVENASLSPTGRFVMYDKYVWKSSWHYCYLYDIKQNKKEKLRHWPTNAFWLTFK